ncbi:MAG: response regulator [Butyrivibrio sp.]|uniref:ATP-binding protein n=1 Tax=Butyrivibrio sp. TaxID=28121 RepID=UPI0025C39EBC|nr:ATP-binding protein [Butyrivibrio sp.]MBQ6588477.1 response regulator [Butyrivibrio sp.]
MGAKEKGQWTYSIKTQLRVILAVLIVTPIVFLGIYMYVVARKNLIQQTQIAMEGNTDVIANELESNCNRKSDIVKFFTYEENLRKTLEHANSNPYALSSELSKNIEPLIWYYLSSDTRIESINIYSELISEDHLGDFTHRPETDLEKKWYELCSQDYSTMWVTDGQGGVYVIKALLDIGSSSKLVGVVVLKVKNETFFSSISSTGYLDNGILIVDGDGNIVIHKRIADKALDTEICKVAMGYGIDFMNNAFAEGKGYFLSSSKTFENSWKLFYYVDRAEITADVMSILLSDTVIAIVLFALAFIVASFYAGRFSNRISRLNDMAEQVRKGNFDIQDKDKYKDEIGQLSTAMVGMAGQLNAMVQEINERNEKDLQLKDNDIHYREWLFDFVVERNNDILAVVDGDSYVPSFVTSNVEDVLGIPLNDVKEDIRALNRVHKSEETDGITLEHVFETCRDTGEAFIQDEIQLENVRTGEHLYYRGITVTTIDDGGKRTAIALYDRTQEIKRNHQLQEALNAAETANKAKTSFLANMSHDFRTPMNAITGFNLLIDKHADEPEKVKEYTHKISLASQNLLSMLNDVLDMSKIESGKTTLDIKEMPIGLLLEEINSVISFQAKNKNQEYVVTVGGLQHDIFMGDKQRINEILMNILGNAIKYTPEGGRIEFSIIESSSSSEGFQNVTFTIKDNGIGMKPEYKDKIFDAFSREEKGATKTIQGTGLGMAITKSLVELMGGTIRVESEEGKGSTFIVNLRLKAIESDVDFWKANGIYTMLVVNGDKAEDEKHRKAYANEDLDVTRAFTGSEALKYVDEMRSDNKHYDFILIDETIDDTTVVELVKNIRARDNKNNSLIFAVTDNYEMNADALKAAGCNDILQKPVFVTNLKQAIEDVTKMNAEKEEEPTNPLEGMHFLAAEDNDINADILIELMDMFGATVTRGVNGQEVVELFKKAKEGDYDMILMDIQMPVMNGYEAAAAIRSIQTDWAQRIPIIAMTANAYADDVQLAFDAGMNAHVTKPIDIKVVEKTILEFKNK